MVLLTCVLFSVLFRIILTLEFDNQSFQTATQSTKQLLIFGSPKLVSTEMVQEKLDHAEKGQDKAKQELQGETMGSETAVDLSDFEGNNGYLWVYAKKHSGLSHMIG